MGLGRKGRIDQALEIYQSLPTPTIRQMNAMIDACSRSQPVRLELAFDLLQQAPVPPNVYTFGSLMSVCARAGSVTRARRVLQTMEGEYGVTPNAVVYNAAVSACGRAQPPRPDVALEWLQQAQQRGLSMSVVGYNAAISAAAHAGDWQGAVELLRQMEPTTETTDPTTSSTTSPYDDNGSVGKIPRPDAVTYGTVLYAFERGGQWQRILEFAEYMQTIGQPLDGLAITSVLHACQALGLAQEAVRYLKLMKSQQTAACPSRHRHTAGWELPGGPKPLQGPDAVAYLLTVSACARGGDWIRAMDLLNEYCQSSSISNRNPEVDLNIFTAAITGCEYAGKWEEAFFVLDRMRKQQVEPNQVAFAAVLGACATACANLVQHEQQSPQTDSTLAAIPSVSAKDPKRKALRLLSVMHKDASVVSPTTLVYNAAIRTCAEALDVPRAFQLYHEMVEDHDLAPNVVTFGSLMTACERTGNMDGMNTVFSLLKKFQRQQPQRDKDTADPSAEVVKANDVIYGAAISCCRKAGGEEERALFLLQKMIQEGLAVNVATLNTALMVQAEARHTTNLLKIYQMVRAHNMQQKEEGDKNKNNKSVVSRPNRQTFHILIRGLAADKKRAKEAEAVLRDMRESGFPPDVDLYTLVVSAYERTGQPLQALRLMESMNAQGYAFYEDKVLNAAFKRLLKMANLVGQRLSSSSSSSSSSLSLDTDDHS